MKELLDKNRAGIIGGLFLAIMHAVWALAVAIIPSTLQGFLDWVFGLHFLEPYFVLTAFNFPNAVLLVILTFVCGYICGWVFAAVCNWIRK
jgi:hypothetical protein